MVFFLPTNPDAMKYMPGLDWLRALAVLLVVWAHTMPLKYRPFGGLLGHVGVDLFFVLSGYLMTRILLECRVHATGGRATVGVYARFHLRRMLRIDPVYWALLTVLFLTGVLASTGAWWKDGLVYYLYGFNWYVNWVAWDGIVEEVIPLWSLAVEYQFYVALPLLVFWLRTMERLRVAFWALAIVGFASQLAFAAGLGELLGFPSGTSARISQSYSLTPCCFMPLAFGGILAVDQASGRLARIWNDPRRRYGWGLGGGLLFLFGLWCSGQILDDPLVNRTWLRVGDSVFGAWLVVALSAESGRSPFEGRDIGSRLILHIGKVSYGLYLFHKCVPTLLVELGMATTDWFWFLAEYGAWEIFQPTHRSYSFVFRVVEFGWELLVALVISTVSWWTLERFFNRLKRFVGYDGMRLPGRHVEPPPADKG